MKCTYCEFESDYPIGIRIHKGKAHELKNRSRF